jgi:hypothetical protein
MLKVDIMDDPGSGWNQSLLEGHTESLTLFHTTFWMDRMEALLGFKPHYFCVSDDAGPLLKIAVQTFREKTGFVRKSLRAIKHGRLLKTSNVSWNGQPVAFRKAGEEAYSKLAEALVEFIRDEKLAFSQGEWPVQMVHTLPPQFNRKTWATLKIMLDGGFEATQEKMKHAARKAVNKAIRDGVTVRRIDTLEELRSYSDFAHECAKRYGKKLIGFKDFETMWEHIRTNGIYETFVAEHGGEMIGSLSVWGYGIHIAELGSFQSERSYSEKLYGSDLIKWEIIRWACGNGIESFDLSGIDPAPVDAKAKSIKQFKEKWGGNYLEYLILN